MLDCWKCICVIIPYHGGDPMQRKRERSEAEADPEVDVGGAAAQSAP